MTICMFSLSRIQSNKRKSNTPGQLYVRSFVPIGETLMPAELVLTKDSNPVKELAENCSLFRYSDKSHMLILGTADLSREKGQGATQVLSLSLHSTSVP